MPPLSCPHADVSCTSQNWPSAEARCVTAPTRGVSVAIAATIAAHVARRRFTSADPDLALHRGHELRRVVANAVLEHRRHLADVGRLRDRIAANDDEIGALAGGD